MLRQALPPNRVTQALAPHLLSIGLAGEDSPIYSGRDLLSPDIFTLKIGCIIHIHFGTVFGTPRIHGAARAAMLLTGGRGHLLFERRYSKGPSPTPPDGIQELKQPNHVLVPYEHHKTS